MAAPAAKPQIYVSSLYFIEGLPYTIVTQMSVVMLKNLGASNEYIGLMTTTLTIPWAIKLLWAPLVDQFGTRRRWILVAHLVLAILTVLLAASMFVPNFNDVSILLFALIAFASATQDIATDGYYMDVLNKEEQSLYVGIRGAAYKLAWLTGSGALVFLSGRLASLSPLGPHLGWGASFAVCALIFACAWLFHSTFLPHPTELHKGQDASNSAFQQLRTQFKDVFVSYVTQPRAAWILAYILLFRLGDALMMKMAPPFLLDKRSIGGLAISTDDVGIIFGTVGTVFLLIGGIVGSWLVSRFGLKRCLAPAAVFQSLAILLYWGLACYQPGKEAVACVNAFEQFSYGIGCAAYTIYLMSTVRPEYKASHYAIATGIMAVGLMVPGWVSGYLTKLGYPAFFLISFAASIPGIATIFFLPFKEEHMPKVATQEIQES